MTAISTLRQRLQSTVLGQTEAIDHLLTALLADGHVILEGVPGLAKTLLARTLAATLQVSYRRVQFTPDLMPSDLVGTNIFLPAQQEFRFRPGPVFTEVLLADELNRTPPKTQSALLEAMEERQVTVDGETHPLPPHFFVIATQNPIELEGTFSLPEAQIDRFLLKIVLTYPSQADEEFLLRRMIAPEGAGTAPLAIPSGQLAEWKKAVAQVHVAPTLCDYTVALVRASRQDSRLLLGASPRAAQGWLRAARARAYLKGRDFVTPDDLQELAWPVLCHRLLRSADAEMDGVPVEDLVQDLIAAVPVPK